MKPAMQPGHYLGTEIDEKWWRQITGFKTGRWHGGKWGAGRPVLKILWTREGQRLSSGFLISNDASDIERLITALTSGMQK